MVNIIIETIAICMQSQFFHHLESIFIYISILTNPSDFSTSINLSSDLMIGNR